MKVSISSTLQDSPGKRPEPPIFLITHFCFLRYNYTNFSRIMKGKTNLINKNILVFSIIGALITANFLQVGPIPKLLNSAPNLQQLANFDAFMSNRQFPPTDIDPTPVGGDQCVASSNQTVVQWKSKNFYCRFSWKGICFWPPFAHKHATYKVTIKDGIPLRDKNNQIIPIAHGKIRNWEVFDATAWNNIANSPRLLARYPDYEPIASNEYVVMVETRYRLFNNVESTLRICVQ